MSGVSAGAAGRDVLPAIPLRYMVYTEGEVSPSAASGLSTRRKVGGARIGRVLARSPEERATRREPALEHARLALSRSEPRASMRGGCHWVGQQSGTQRAAPSAKH